MWCLHCDQYLYEMVETHHLINNQMWRIICRIEGGKKQMKATQVLNIVSQEFQATF